MTYAEAIDLLELQKADREAAEAVQNADGKKKTPLRRMHDGIMARVRRENGIR